MVGSGSMPATAAQAQRQLLEQPSVQLSVEPQIEEAPALPGVGQELRLSLDVREAEYNSTTIESFSDTPATPSAPTWRWQLAEASAIDLSGGIEAAEPAQMVDSVLVQLLTWR